MHVTDMSEYSAFDAAMMQLALRQAKRGLGTTAPNPSVGAVIADTTTQEIISTGVTQPGGRPHAEAEALRKAGHRARGATMYVTLEPCAHTGRTPTCADQILSAGLKRVVAAQADPNALIAGRGFAQLRTADIAVQVGLMEQVARRLTAGHNLRQSIGRPSVLLKLAISHDDRMPPGNGKPVWITGPEARARAHLMRAEADAMIVGIKTILADDPELTCRLPGLTHRSPQRVVIDNRLRTPANARALQPHVAGKPTLLATILTDADMATAARQSSHVEILARLGTTKTSNAQSNARNLVDLRMLLEDLARRGVTRVMVEGGPTVADNMLAADLVDEIAIFRSPHTLGPDGTPVAAVATIAAKTQTPQWTVIEDRLIGRDRLTRYSRIY